MGGAWRAIGSGRWAERKMRLRLQDLASELAFHRWRTARGIFPRTGTPAAREAGYLAQLYAIAAQLGWTRATPVPPPGGWTIPPLPPTATVAPRRKLARAPRSGGFRGLAVAVTSIGCLGVLVLGVFGIGILLYAAGSGHGTPTPVVQSEEAAEAATAAELLPEELGGLRLLDPLELDAETLTMFGAIDGLLGEYESEMKLLLLRFRSPELAADAIEPLRSAMFPERAGWRAVARGVGNAAPGFEVKQAKTNEAASAWNRGSLVMIFSGDAERLPQFAQPGEMVASPTR